MACVEAGIHFIPSRQFREDSFADDHGCLSSAVSALLFISNAGLHEDAHADMDACVSSHKLTDGPGLSGSTHAVMKQGGMHQTSTVLFHLAPRRCFMAT